MGHKNPFERTILAVGSPYGALLLVLAVMLLVYPFLGSHAVVSWLFDAMMLGLVASALRVIHGRGAAYILSLLLGASAFIAGLLGRSLGVETAYPVGAGLRTVFMAFLIIIIFSDIMRSRKVTFDTVLAASSVFVLLGLAFGSAYALFEWLMPGSFQIPVASRSIDTIFGQTSTEFNLVYFSLVTMSTVGFGDIVPVLAPARSIAAIEGLLGQLYLAIIIARLVGLEIASHMRDSATSDGD